MINQEEKDLIYDAIFHNVKAGDDIANATLVDWQVNAMITLDLYALDSEIEDMLGFIKWARDNDQTAAFIASTLSHDISGISRPNNPGFAPKTSGYSKFLKTEKPKMRVPAWVKGMGYDFTR